jgi:hypothetical protein
VVNFRAAAGVRAGDLVQVDLVEASPHSLIGELRAVQPGARAADERAQPIGLV